MYKFSKEKELIDYIIKNENHIKIKEGNVDINSKKIIDTKFLYGLYFNEKTNKNSRKESDLVFIDDNTISFSEVKSGRITNQIVQLAKQSIKDKYFYKKIEVIFIGTIISKKVREKIEASENLKYVIIDDVKYEHEYKNNIEIAKHSFEGNIEKLAYSVINGIPNIIFGMCNLESYRLDQKGTELKLKFRYWFGYGFNLYFSFDTYNNENWSIEIVNCDNIGLNERREKRASQGLIDEIKNILFLFWNMSRNERFFENKDINTILETIELCSSQN